VALTQGMLGSILYTLAVRYAHIRPLIDGDGGAKSFFCEDFKHTSCGDGIIVDDEKVLCDDDGVPSKIDRANQDFVQRLCWALELMGSIEFLHSVGIAHRGRLAVPRDRGESFVAALASFRGHS
jgi:hypothetical protein